MPAPFYNRRSFLVTAGLTGAALVRGPVGALASYAPTRSMRGGANNYHPGAPVVDRLGKGFFVTVVPASVLQERTRPSGIRHVHTDRRFGTRSMGGFVGVRWLGGHSRRRPSG